MFRDDCPDGRLTHSKLRYIMKTGCPLGNKT